MAVLLFLFGGRPLPLPKPVPQVMMIRLSQGAGAWEAPLSQQPPRTQISTPPGSGTPPIPAVKTPVEAPPRPPAPVKPPPVPQPKPQRPSDKEEVHLGKDKSPPKPPTAISRPPRPQTQEPIKAPAPDEQKIAEALSQIQSELETREAKPGSSAGTPKTSGSGPAYGPPGGPVAATDPGLAQYQSSVRSKIVREWVRANTGSAEGAVLRTRIKVKIDASGSVLSKSIVKRSGNESFDLSALRAVERASPLPPPPSGIMAEALAEGLIVDFSSRMLGTH